MKKLTLLLLAAAAWAGDDVESKAAQRAKSTIESLDADGDGRVSKDEFLGSDSIFERWDADKDGFLTEAEVAKGLAAPRPKAKPERDAREGGRRGPPDPEQMRRRIEGLMKRLDKDGDGKIAGDEIPQRGNWKRMDKNGDGAIDVEELSAGMQARGRGRGGDVVKRLMAMDANKDGKIAKDEWKARPEGFARLDKDKDGFLTKPEIEEIAKGMRRRGGWKRGPADALFRRMDADQDKRITKEEWKLAPEMFDRFDANGDGAITEDEVLPKDPREPVPGANGSARFFEKYDKNKDGKIDAAEFGNERRFAAMDGDGDGALTKAEVEQAFDKRDREEKMSFVDRFDLDRDGKVTREEFKGPAKYFDRLDKNGDGVIDEADRKRGPR